MERIIIFLFVFLLVIPAISADESLVIPMGDQIFLSASFDNCTKINQEKIAPGNFTTAHNLTFHWENAIKITYKNNEGKTDYVIVWQCNTSEEYYILYSLHDLNYYYSDYTKDNKSVVYVENYGDYSYGILVDAQNITYSEEDLVHGILGRYSYELTNSGYHYNPPIDVKDGSPHYTSYKNSKNDQWAMAINDPDWYYDHYDYGDNGDIDDYLDEYYYW